jgi:hypothetical protein
MTHGHDLIPKVVKARSSSPHRQSSETRTSKRLATQTKAAWESDEGLRADLAAPLPSSLLIPRQRTVTSSRDVPSVPAKVFENAGPDVFWEIGFC